MKLNVLVWDVVLEIDPGAARVVVVKLPGRDCAVVLYATLDVNHSCRAKVGPGKFFFTGPDQLHRLIGSLCQTRRFNRSFPRVLAAVTRTSIGHYHPHLLVRNM